MQRYSPLRLAQRLTITPNCSREKLEVSKQLGGQLSLRSHVFFLYLQAFSCLLTSLPGGEDLAMGNGVPILQLFGEPRDDVGMLRCHVVLFGRV